MRRWTPKLPRLRVLPLTILVALAVTGARTTALVARAAEPAPPKSAAATPVSAKPAETAKPEPKPQEPPLKTESPDYSTAELRMLQSLTERREALDKREAQLAEREAVLKSTDEKVQAKLAELNRVKAELEKLLDTARTRSDEQFTGLVKIYEAMKPKEAARIFDVLETPVLCEVLGRMKEAKAAMVLAAMAPERAREATDRIAEMRKQKPLADVINAAAAEPGGKAKN